MEDNSGVGRSARYVVFALSGQSFALPLESVARVVPMAELMPAPGLPGFVEGLLDVGGDTVAVLRPDRLLELPEARVPGLHTPIVLLKERRDGEGAVGLLVESVSGITAARPDAATPLPPETTFNDCVSARVAVRTDAPPIPLLDPERLLLREERARIAAHAARAAARRAALEPSDGSGAYG